jgi:hypothetical protein
MATSVAVRERGAVARPLKVLVPLIKQELERGDAAGVEHYRRAGEMLIEAREQVARGEWTAWLEKNFELSHGTAKRWMKLAVVSADRRRSVRSIQEVVEPNRPNRIVPPAYHEPVQRVTERVDVDRLMQERQDRQKEERLIHDLALQLIDIGYKVLVTKLHPDKGGSQESMQRLNRVRELLRAAVE